MIQRVAYRFYILRCPFHPKLWQNVLMIIYRASYSPRNKIGEKFFIDDRPMLLLLKPQLLGKSLKIY